MEATREAKEPAAADLGDLLDAGDGSVVTLVAGETHLAAHRAVLERGSPVFAAMFRHDTLEASSGEVAVADVAGPVLRLLLAFLYCPRVPPLPVAVLLQLLAAADKYGVAALKEACERQAAAQLTVEAAAAAAVTAVRHCCSGLREAAVAFIKSHAFEVMATRGWADAVRTQPEEVVEISRLLSETVVPPAAGPHGDGRHSPASAAPAPSSSPPPDDASIARLRMAEETGLREGQISVFRDLGKEALIRWEGQTRSLLPEEKGRRLREAAKQGAVGELEALLAAGTAVDARGGGRITALHEAAGNGHTAAVRLLLAAGADHGARDVAGDTPLHWVALGGHREAAAALLEGGADRAARTNGGQTALAIARVINHHQVAAVLQRR